jgi:hypothetical protein
VNAEREDPRERLAQQQPPYALDAADVRQRDVHHHHVGIDLAEGLIRLGRGSRLPHDADIARSFQQTPIALANDRMIIDKQDADAWGPAQAILA